MESDIFEYGRTRNVDRSSHLPGGQILSEILTKGVFPTASLMLSRGGPYPSPLALTLRAVAVLFDWTEAADNDGATKAETPECWPSLERAAAPKNARIDLANCMVMMKRSRVLCCVVLVLYVC